MTDKMTTEERIFRAAMALFIKKGKHGAKMQEIADQAQINKAMLHYYFRSKEKLFAHVFETVAGKVFGSLHTLFKDEVPFSVSLRLFIDNYISMLNSNPHILMFILREIGEGGETALNTIDDMLKKGAFKLPDAFVKAADNAVQKKEIKAVNGIQLMLSVIGAANYFFFAEPMIRGLLESNKSYNRKEFLEQRKHDIFDLVYNGIKI